MYISAIFHSGCPTSSLAAEPINFDRIFCSSCHQKASPRNPNWTINRLPCPIVEDHPSCSVVIKPSDGHFRSYKFGDDLHIGIADSRGAVHSFWTQGIETQDSTWQDSLILVSLNSCSYLDKSLKIFKETDTRFCKTKYSDDTWNCFDFVLEFLRFIAFRDYSKLDFSREFTTKKLQAVVKYFTLFEKLKAQN
ncbi:Protein CBG07069 [Caenorhabditis briggsae]|nr:Protein CBG07069 [Caenorhabditis briggsae]ULU08897.1 hypothetical protein L3Y34_019843 [Caenorhabditis briggsae]UMM20795.1 hypothetical protein L5515_015932 [Caenorhabditis briggsae]CAP27283.1 Protein CBG07069 [Caenorhabditis briggsae]